MLIKKTISILLFLFLIALELSAQNINVKSFHSAPDDMTARVTAPVTDQNGDKCALIKIKTTQTGFAFEGDMMGIEKTVQKVAEIWVYVPFGAKKISIAHQNLGRLDNYKYTEPIKEATVYVMELTTANVRTVVEKVETPMQWLAIESEPEGADVYIDDQYLGTTPYAKKMEVGKYNYRIEKSMYHSQAGVVNLTSDKKETINLSLKPNFGYAKITSSPENGASIELDGQPVNGKTPYITSKLISGKHRVTVKKPMFSAKTIEFNVADGQTINVNVSLGANFGTVNISTTPLADIYIDDERVGKGKYIGRVMPGMHTFEAKKEKYTSYKTQVEVYAGQEKSISLYPKPKTGQIDITSKPFGAQISMNGKNYGTTPATISKLLIGDYKLTLSKAGYGSINKRITIYHKQTTSIDETLPKGKQITITSKPSGVKLKIDGNDYGKTPWKGELAFGNHDIVLINGDFKMEEIIVTSQDVNNVFNFNVFPPFGNFTDPRDGESYKYLTIGNQIWMGENLRYKYGKQITSQDEWDFKQYNRPAYCCYDNDEAYKATHGVIYNYAAAVNACPDGWHLPSDEEWKILERQLGMSEMEVNKDNNRGRRYEGDKLKSEDGWARNGNGIDDYGFTALASGFRTIDYIGMGNWCWWWTSTQFNSKKAWHRVLHYGNSHIGRFTRSKNDGHSVRCIKD